MESFKTNVDAWIKQIRSEFAEMKGLALSVDEHTENIDHNYELIQELRHEIEGLKSEVKALTILQVARIKEKGEF